MQMFSHPFPEGYSLLPLQENDTEDIFTSIDTQRKHLGRWLPFVATTHRIEQTREVVTEMLADTSNPIFTLRHNGTFAGLIGFKSADYTAHTVEIGYWIREEHQGCGAMTAAVRALCDIAFAEMKMQQVTIRCAVDNTRSNRIPQRLGFRMDHVEPEGELLSDGHYTDLNVYQLDRQ